MHQSGNLSAVQEPKRQRQSVISHKTLSGFPRKVSRRNTENLPQTLQTQYGNYVTGRLIQSGQLQALMKVSQPGDIYEQEAEQTATRIMSMPEPAVFREGPTEEEEEERVSRHVLQKPAGEAILPSGIDEDATLDTRQTELIRKSTTGGEPLPHQARAFFENRFGDNFNHVRIHHDQAAGEAASSINARAFTLGNHIVFAKNEYSPDSHSGRKLLAHELTHVLQQNTPRTGQKSQTAACQSAVTGNLIQRIPPPGDNFGTRNGQGFRITTPIRGFVLSHIAGDLDVDFTGNTWMLMNAWSSVWELYDAQDKKIDSDTKIPFGGYTITPANLKKGQPGDGRSKWSLWYRIVTQNPWSRGNDYYPYDYAAFDVYSQPVSDPRTTLKEETGNIVWQDNFTPAEDGASLKFIHSSTATRATTDSQTTTVSTTISGERSSSFGFEFEGLTGGFASKLGISATASISRTHQLSVSNTVNITKEFSQPNLRKGITYKIVCRPLYHIINGSVNLISQRDGIITGNSQTINGGIRLLKGMDIKVEQ